MGRVGIFSELYPRIHEGFLNHHSALDLKVRLSSTLTEDLFTQKLNMLTTSQVSLARTGWQAKLEAHEFCKDHEAFDGTGVLSERRNRENNTYTFLSLGTNQ